jgi:hypothetical protein
LPGGEQVRTLFESVWDIDGLLLEAEVMLLLGGCSTENQVHFRRVIAGCEKDLVVWLASVGRELKDVRHRKLRAFSRLLDGDDKTCPGLDAVRDLVALLFVRASDMDHRLNIALLSARRPAFSKRELNAFSERYGALLPIPDLLEEKVARFENKIRVAARRPEANDMADEARACLAVGKDIRALRRLFNDILSATALLQGRAGTVKKFRTRNYDAFAR